MSKVKVHVIATAQKYTDVDTRALAVLQNYVKERNGRLHVLPLNYNTKEKDLFGYESVKDAPLFDPLISKYLVSKDIHLNDNVVIMPHLHAGATTRDQLSGLLTASKDKSAVFAGVRHASRSVATPGHEIPKLLYVAPTVTRPKYSPSGKGILAYKDHNIGAVVVEIKNKKIFHIRTMTINSNYQMHDLDRLYREKGKSKRSLPIGLIVGDLHHMWADPLAVKGIFTGSNSVVKTMKPPKIVIHDFIDFFSGNHHHVGDKILEFLKNKYGYDNIHNELLQAMGFISQVTPPGSTSYIVPSNHCDALDRWLNSGRGDSDPVNAPLYHLLNYCRYTNASMEGPRAVTSNPIEDFAKQFCPETLARVKFLSLGEPLTVGDHACEYHGDKGLGGSRGSFRAFCNLGKPVQTGHNHGPERFLNNGQVGTTSLLDMGYNFGPPSNWLHTGSLIYPDHTWSLINFIEGEYRI